jgi:hypothetical protein
MINARNTTYFAAWHLVFWVLSVFVLMLVFNTSGKLQWIDVVYVAVFHLSLAPLFYLNVMVMMPRLFQAGKYLWFFLAATLATLLFTFFSELLFSRFADYVFPGFYFVSDISLRDNVLVHGFYLAASSMMVLSGSWFREARQKQQIITLEKEKIKTELQMLKNQVNPHFFFNTLQSLYALALKKSDELPGMILKLSDLMRYVIYEADTEKIQIQKEIIFLENYLELQKLRLTKDADVKFEVDGTDNEVEIIPLLLIHFVENCFKHGLKGEAGKVFAHMTLKYAPDQIFFTAVNNQKKRMGSATADNPGTGLENVKRRLQLHYPGKHELEIKSRETSFEIALKIHLS